MPSSLASSLPAWRIDLLLACMPIQDNFNLWKNTLNLLALIASSTSY